MASVGKSIAGREHLIGKLQDAGLSHRWAVRILNAVLDAMKEALQRGEQVEFAWGKLRRKRLWREEHSVLIGHRPARRRPYKVEWRWDEAEDRLLNPEKWAGVPQPRRPPEGAKKWQIT